MSQRVRLSPRDIDPLVCPPGKQDITFGIDDRVRGLRLRVTASGAKIFLLQYKRGKAVRRLPLGRYGEISLTDVLRMAEQARGKIAGGADPVAEKASTLAAEQAKRAERKAAKTADALTLEKLVGQWAAVALKDRSAAHRRDGPSAIARDLAAMWSKPAHGITVKAAQVRIDAIGAKSPTMAHHVRAYARAAFNWGLKRGLVPENPFASVVIESRQVSRDRALSQAELGAVWNAAGAMAYPFGPLLRLMLLTLQRRSEVAGMRWPELSPDLTTWTLPAARAKNRRAHVVHLAPAARTILEAIPRRLGSDLVFTTTGRTPPSGFSSVTDQLRNAAAEAAGEAAEAEGGIWRLHDFRRTGVTELARLEVAPHVADRLLNHVGGTISGVAAVYQRHQFMAERQAALLLWAETVLAAGRQAADKARDQGDGP